MFSVKFNLESEADVERLSKTGYEIILLDTCFIVNFITDLDRVLKPDAIKTSRKLPCICDFTKRELRHLILREKKGFNPWRRLQQYLKNGSIIILLRTGIVRSGQIAREPLDEIVERLGRGCIKPFVKAYGGWRARSNMKDLALYLSAVKLAIHGVKVAVATTDRRLRLALELANIPTYRSPWPPHPPERW